MPEKPIVTSATNQHYQKRFDRLAELAAVGDWTAIPPMRSRAIIPTRRRSRVTAIGCSPLTPRRRPPHSYAACFRTSLDRLLLDFPPDTAWASGASDQRIFILRRHRLTLRAATRRTIRWICPR
jgi:hypothetical protein